MVFDPLKFSPLDNDLSSNPNFSLIDEPLDVDDEETDGAFMFGVDQAQSLLGHGVQAVEDVFGADTTYGDDYVKKQDAEIKVGGYKSTYQGNLVDQDVMDMPGWLAEKLAENAAMSAPALVGGVAAAASAPFSVAAALTITGASAILSGFMGTGEVASEMKDMGVYDPKIALAGGAVIALLDKVGSGIVSAGSVSKSLIKLGVKKEVAGEMVAEAAKNGVGRELAKRAFAEGFTEVLQEGVNVVASASQGAEYKAVDLAKRGVDAFALGGAMGGGFGAGSMGLEAGLKSFKSDVEVAVDEVELTSEDIDAPTPNDLTLSGKKIMAEGEAKNASNAVLNENGLPSIGEPISVTIGGESRLGTISGTFTETNAELGISDIGVKIDFDDGTSTDEFMKSIADGSVSITPTGEDTALTNEFIPDTPAPPVTDAEQAENTNKTTLDMSEAAANDFAIGKNIHNRVKQIKADFGDQAAAQYEAAFNALLDIQEAETVAAAPPVAEIETVVEEDQGLNTLVGEDVPLPDDFTQDATIENVDNAMQGRQWYKIEEAEQNQIAQSFGQTADQFGNTLDQVSYVAGDKAAVEPVTNDESLPVKKPLSDAVTKHFNDGNGFKNIVAARKFAKEHAPDLSNKEIEEAIELGVVQQARKIVADGASAEETYAALQDLYSKQPILGSRTSTSVENQAYSTPAPLSFIASQAAGIGRDTTVYEPTAGNGMLVIGADPKNITANELNADRFASLQATIGDADLTNGDAMATAPKAKVDVVIANPPFGKVIDGDKNKIFPLGESTTTEIDHAISLKSLESMKDDGKAVLIIGSQHGRTISSNPKESALKYRSDNARRFFVKLYKEYNVTDHYTVDGKLYNKQGAAWPVDVIVIEGRSESALDLPMKTAPAVISSWENLGAKLNDRNSVDTTEQADGDGQTVEDANETADAGSVQDGDGVTDRSDDSKGNTRTGEGASGSDVRQGESSDGQQSSSSGGNPSGEQRPSISRGDGAVSDTSDANSKQAGTASSDEGGNSGGISGDAVSDVDDFDSIFDNALDELFGAKEPEATESKARIYPEANQPTATQSATSAASNTVKGLDEVTEGLSQLFGGGKTISSGINFDKETYEKAKPLFIKGVSHFKTAGTDIAAMVKALVGHLANAGKFSRDAIMSMKPYIQQFVEDIKAGIVSLAEKKEEAAPKKEETSQEPLAAPKPIKLDASITTKKELLEATQEAYIFYNELASRPDLYEQLPSFIKFDPRDRGKMEDGFRRMRSAMENKYKQGWKGNYADATWTESAASLNGGIKGVDLLDAYTLNDIVKEYRKAFKTAKTKRGEQKAPKKAERVNEEAETAYQVKYSPTSQARYAVGTLVPRNMQTAITKALSNLESRVGNIDQYVADKLDYSVDEVVGTDDKPGYFSAEQVDALALAVDNAESGNGFIVGDQTGVGKGRFVAGMLKYALANGKTPIFITKSPGLFADMIRDMRDIGMVDIDKSVLVHNSNLRGDQVIPLDASDPNDVLAALAPKYQKLAMQHIEDNGTLPDGHNVLFTTYKQLQYNSGKDNIRQRGVLKLAPNAVFVLDESHLAGGTDAPRSKDAEGEEKKTGADFIRDALADADGVIYSSATFAKNPAVMSLYFKTDLALAVDKIEDLAPTIKAGGVPLQQVVSNMLVESGQYARRERSFEGVSIKQTPLKTDKELAESTSETLREIFTLDKDYLEEARKEFIDNLENEGFKGANDGAIGEVSASQTGFSSIMHNVVSQMLLSLKAKAAVDLAIELHKKGEKPIIALANTSGSIMDDYIVDNNLKDGDEADMQFNVILQRYVQRLRRITIKDDNKKKTRITMTNDQVLKYGGVDALQELQRIEKLVEESDLSELPGSPIDYIIDRLEAAGIKTGEITGRSDTISGGILTSRKSSEADKKRAMNGYNSGEIDALVINQSGSTGFSMHATAQPGNDGKQRHMIVLQPDPNIDIFMQMLGRIHRTGQIKLPNYTLGISDLAVEKRLAAVLMRKLASLNANTTASKDSAVGLDGSVDFMNKYGDEVVYEYLQENEEVADMTGMAGKAKEGLASKFTGKLAILDPVFVEKIYKDIESSYTDYVESLDRMGLNTLEAKTLELDAKTTDTKALVESKGDSDSIFSAAAKIETVSAKKLGKPFTMDELKKEIDKTLDGKEADEFAAAQGEEIKAKMPEYIEKIDASIKKAESKLEELKKEAQVAATKKAADEGREAPNFDPEKGPVTQLRGKRVEGAEASVDVWKKKKEEAQQKIEDMVGQLDSYRPGKTYTIKVVDGVITQTIEAVSLGVNIKGVTGNPTAASSYKIRFAIADAGREIIVPLSKFTSEEATYSTESASGGVVREAFENGVTEARETRQIITGNILSGYAKFKKGQIIMFTRDGGSRSQGIMMPKDFDLQKELEKEAVKFTDLSQIAPFLEKGDGTRRIHSEDDIIAFTYDRYNGLMLNIRSKNGKRFALNKAVRNILGDIETTKSARTWKKVIKSADDLVAIAEIYGVDFVTSTHKDEARLVTDPEVKYAIPRSNVTQEFTADVLEKMPRIEQALKARLKQLGLSEKIAVEFVERIPSLNVGRPIGSYSRGLIQVAMKAADPQWIMNHEVIHALKDLGVFRELEWRALKNAAFDDKKLMADVKSRYPDLGTEAQLEEAIADMFAEYVEGKKAGGPIKRAFDRAVNFIKALYRSFKGQGFNTAEDIFEGIESGEIGSRDMDALIDEMEAKPVKEARRKPLPKHIPYANADRGAAIEASNGVDQPSLLANIKEGLRGIAADFSRHYGKLPNTPQFAQVKEWLRSMEAAPEASKAKVIRILKGITDGMSQADLEIFTRKLILDDLLFEADSERVMAFGFESREDVEAELAAVDPFINGRPDLQEKLRQRKMISQHVARMLVDAGVLTEEQIANPNYFRHQILEYAELKNRKTKGVGSQIENPRSFNRKGSDKSFNANYLEAEFDWLHKAFVDIATATLILKIKESAINIRDRVVGAAKVHNDTAIQKLIAEDVAKNGYMVGVRLTSPMNERWISYKQGIAMGLENIAKQVNDGTLSVPERFQSVANSIADTESQAEESIFPFLSWLMDGGKPGAMGAAMVFKATNARKAWVKESLGDNYANPLKIDQLISMGLAPEGYRSWQPEGGKILFTASSLSDKAVDSIAAKIKASDIGTTEDIADEIKDHLKDVLVVGGDKYKMILPEELADTLDSIKDSDVVDALATELGKVTRRWKIWRLLNPRGYIKYNLNNFSGDVDAVIAGNPRALTRMKQAIGELRDVRYKDASPSARMQEALDRGVIGSGGTLQEIPDIHQLDEFSKLLDESTMSPGKFSVKKITAMWNIMKKFNNFREDWLRYATYLDYADRVEAGDSMESIGYGASLPKIVDAITDPTDKAAHLARELVGDYGNVSVIGQRVRAKYIPFYSWMEINTKRYWRLSGNAFSQGVGKGLATGTGLAAGVGARKTAWLATRALTLYVLINVWNQGMFGDEEDELTPEARSRLHLNLGRWGGEIQTVKLQGALSDFLGWVGFQDVMSGYNKLETGESDWGDVWDSVWKAPINRIGNAVTPLVKTPLEILSGSWFPDMFNMSKVRDWKRHVAQTFALEHEYDALNNNPSKGYMQSWKNAVVYSRDPGESAYNRILTRAYAWNDKRMGREGSGSFAQSDRSSAVYNYKRAVKFRDKNAAKSAYTDLERIIKRDNASGLRVRTDVDRVLRESANRAKPLNVIPLNLRFKFKQQLSAREKQQLKAAIKWHADTFR